MEQKKKIKKTKEMEGVLEVNGPFVDQKPKGEAKRCKLGSPGKEHGTRKSLGLGQRRDARNKGVLRGAIGEIRKYPSRITMLTKFCIVRTAQSEENTHSAAKTQARTEGKQKERQKGKG